MLTAIGLTPGGSGAVQYSTVQYSAVHSYTQTIYRTTQLTQPIYRTTQLTQTIHRTTQLTNWEECRPCLVFASYTLAFALQLKKKHGKASVLRNELMFGLKNRV